MASFVTYFYNQGGTCPKSQTKNGGSWFSSVSARFRKKPGIFDRIRACRTIAQLDRISFAGLPDHQLAKAWRRMNRQCREVLQRFEASQANRQHSLRSALS